MQVDLKGKVALVTGGGRDIGRAVSIALAGSGAAVAVNYNSSADKANDVVRAIEDNGGRAIAIKADVTSEAQISAMIGAIHSGTSISRRRLYASA